MLPLEWGEHEGGKKGDVTCHEIHLLREREGGKGKEEGFSGSLAIKHNNIE